MTVQQQQQQPIDQCDGNDYYDKYFWQQQEQQERTATVRTMIVLSACVFQCFTIFVWNAIDVLTSELFPTSVRATGMGVCSATGRIGAMLAQFVNGWLISPRGGGDVTPRVGRTDDDPTRRSNRTTGPRLHANKYDHDDIIFTNDTSGGWKYNSTTTTKEYYNYADYDFFGTCDQCYNILIIIIFERGRKQHYIVGAPPSLGDIDIPPPTPCHSFLFFFHSFGLYDTADTNDTVSISTTNNNHKNEIFPFCFTIHKVCTKHYFFEDI
jgi:hypothetical protein